MKQSYEPAPIVPRPSVWMRKSDKKKHILAVMESLMESGVGGPTALHIADRSGYRYSSGFIALLWELVDDDLIRADSQPYKSGVCDVRWRFYLPEVFKTRQAVKKMRERDMAR